MGIELKWADKHHPNCVSDMLLDAATKNAILSHLQRGTVPDMLLYGPPGIGKTTLANLVVKELGDKCVFLFVKCGTDNSVDMVRGKLQDFIDANYPGMIKVVVLDEADSLSGSASGTEQNSAQKALRSLTVDCKDVRFILTCNQLGVLHPALQSRFTPMKLSFSVGDVLKRCLDITKVENVQTNPDAARRFLEEVINPCFPDVRSIINQLQIWCSSGTLTPVRAIMLTKEIDLFAAEIIKKMETTPVRSISEWYLLNEESFNSDYPALAAAMFRQLYDKPNFQLELSEAIFRMAGCLDKEVQFYSALLKIQKEGTMK